MTQYPTCSHPICAVTYWPGAALDDLIDDPHSVGITVTETMRHRFATSMDRVHYGRGLVSQVTHTPAWDAADDPTLDSVAKSMARILSDHGVHSDNPRAALEALRRGRLRLRAAVTNELIGKVERSCGGDSLPQLGQRLLAAGVTRLVLFEPEHVHAEATFWRQCVNDGVKIVYAVDPGLENVERTIVNLDRHPHPGRLSIAASIREMLAASPVRSDGPPPGDSTAEGVVSLHRVDGCDSDDLGWITASALVSAGVAGRARDRAPVSLSASLDRQGVLVVVPRVDQVSATVRDLERHLGEGVVRLRAGDDDVTAERCRTLLTAVLTDDYQPFAAALHDRVHAVAPHLLPSLEDVTSRVGAATLQGWLVAVADGLRRNRGLKPFAHSLAAVAAATDGTPMKLITTLAGLVDLEANGQSRRTANGAGRFTPTVERARSAATLDEALNVLCRDGWLPCRRVEYVERQPRIVVAAANQVGAVTADVVLIVRPGLRGFTGSGPRGAGDDTAQRILYGCLAAAREQIHVIHRGANDLMPWAEGRTGVSVHCHDLSGLRPARGS
jgi:hypothetical protein